jgi:LmbE family N-acetylglucosaminyl deacetylase
MILDLETVSGPVLVVAPHPDDETLGCGGLIAGLSDRGVLIHTVFVTDGSASHRNSPSFPPSRIAALREAEAAEALARLGASHQPRSFLRLPDSSMPAKGSPPYGAALDTLIALVTSLKPSHAILPWRRDHHCDHCDSWTLFTDAFAEAGHEPQILEYAIWLDELGKPDDFPRQGEVEPVTLDIIPVLERKRRAIDAHQTQLGAVILDDPTGFHLTPETLSRLIKPVETFFRPWPAR